MRSQILAICAAVIAMAPLAAQAEYFATQTFALMPSTIVGADISGSYGGDLAVAFPAALGETDTIAIDLGAYAGALASIGGTVLSTAGAGGLDLTGANKGLDLDAVSATAVPEPENYSLMLGGLGMMGWLARRRLMK